MTMVEARRADGDTDRTALPVVIIGAGPVGLAAAAQLLERGIEPLVLEQGDRAGAAVAEWGHIRLFSPWRHVVDAASVRLLEGGGWVPQLPDALATGAELVRHYLAPLAAALAPRIRFGVRVDAVSRRDMDRTRSTGRSEQPFVLQVADGAGEGQVLARAVIDASGTYSTPNPVASSGVRSRVDRRIDRLVHGGLPDVLGADRGAFAGRHTVVVGAGHSAATTLIALARLADDIPGTTISWLIRSASPLRVYSDSTGAAAEADQLVARATLGSAVHDLVRDGRVALIDRMLISEVGSTVEGRAVIRGARAGEHAEIEADAVVAATGFRPDLDLLREIRLDLDDVVEAPRALAPLIDPNLHSCGTVRPHGVLELSHPEPDFYIAGMKSYGRAPTFLLLTGYEQVRSIAAELAGDHAAAREVRLALPATGACSTSTGSSGAAPTAPLVAGLPLTIGRSGTEVGACCG